MKKTKIICTVGPASEKPEIMEALILSGMNAARNNFSHGDFEEHGGRIKTVEMINEKLGLHVARLLDTKGPEFRTHEFQDEKGNPIKVLIEKGSEVRICFDASNGTATKFSVAYPGLYDDVSIGSTILVDDGYLELTITGKDSEKRELITIAKNSHKIKSRRGINVPNVVLNMPFISEKDRKDIEFAAKMDYNFIAASFTRRAQDVLDIKEILKAQGNTDIQIIAKIENQEGMDNLDEIIEVADGIMVARGDLGVEIAPWDVPGAQKEMVVKCIAAGKIVIVATQMLESMQDNPRPTRAEVNDVANAVYDGTDSTMLSGESAAGNYPIESVSYMAKINEKTEELVDNQVFTQFGFDYSPADNLLSGLAYGVATMVNSGMVDIIIAKGSEVAREVSRFRPNAIIIAEVDTHKEAQSLALNYAVYGVVNKEEKAAIIKAADLRKGAVAAEITSKTIKIVKV